MARHIPQQQTKKTEAPEGSSEANGEESNNEALGPEATPGIETETTTLASLTKGDARIEQPPDAEPPAVYTVSNARPIGILYNGCHSTFHPGKEINAAAYDIEALKSQGVQLTRVSPPLKATGT